MKSRLPERAKPYEKAGRPEPIQERSASGPDRACIDGGWARRRFGKGGLRAGPRPDRKRWGAGAASEREGFRTGQDRICLGLEV